MPELSLRPRPHLKTRVTPQLWGRVKLSNFIELPEDEFRQLIKEIESQPLFKRLIRPEQPREKIISRQRFPHTDLTQHFYQLKEGTTAGYKLPDVAPLLEKRQEIIPLVKKIGLDNFKRYFLYAEDNLSAETIARTCKITPAKVKIVRELMDDFYVLELTHPTSVSSPSPAHLPAVKIAAIEKEDGIDSKQDIFKIGYFSPHYARGNYVVNYKRLFQLKSQSKFSNEEFKKIERFIKDIELINTRQTILYRIIKEIVGIQKDYFRTGREDALKPLTQQMLAHHLKVHRSTVNRAANHKYLETPWGEEKYLKFFLTNQKQVVKRIVSRITKHSTAKLADETIKKVLEKKYHTKLARRTICAYRHELNKNP